MAEPLWMGQTEWEYEDRPFESCVSGLPCAPGTYVAVFDSPLPAPTREQVREAIDSVVNDPNRFDHVVWHRTSADKLDAATDAVMALLSGVPTENRPKPRPAPPAKPNPSDSRPPENTGSGES